MKWDIYFTKWVDLDHADAKLMKRYFLIVKSYYVLDT